MRLALDFKVNIHMAVCLYEVHAKPGIERKSPTQYKDSVCSIHK
jgi:hypothetical protein